MRPSFAKLTDFDTEHTRFASKYSVYLYREGLFPFGPERVHRVGIITGSGGSLIPQAAAAGLDTFITGEGQHWTFFDAEELGLNVLYAGHYATETVGVKALAQHVSKKFDLPWVFLDHPTGL